MKDEVVEIWHQPMAPVAKIMKKIEEECVDPPKEIELNIKLTGVGAARYFLISKIIEEGFGMSEEETAKYLVRLGVEQEIEKLAIAQSIGKE